MKKRLCFLVVSGCGAFALLPPWLASEEVNAPRLIGDDSLLLIKQAAAEATQTIVGSESTQNRTSSTTLIKSKAEPTLSEVSFPAATFESQTDRFEDPAEKFYSDTETLVVADDKDRAARNQKPQVNPAVQQSIQHEINQWSFTENSPINYSIDVTGLFEDPDDDLLTTQNCRQSSEVFSFESRR